MAGDALVALGAGDGEAIPQEPSVFVTNSSLHTPVRSPDRSRKRTVEPSCFGTSTHSSTQLLMPQVPELVLSPLPVPPRASAPPGPQVDLMAQMRQLSSSFQASLDVVKSESRAEEDC